MANFLIPAYAVLLCFVTVGWVRVSLKDREPPAIIAVEIVAALLALAGFLLYHLGYRGPSVSAVWKVAAPAVIASYAFLFLRDIRTIEPDPEFSDTENVWVSTVGSWLAIVTFVPALWFGLVLGYGS